jgi:hypothetical protein
MADRVLWVTVARILIVAAAFISRTHAGLEFQSALMSRDSSVIAHQGRNAMGGKAAARGTIKPTNLKSGFRATGRARSIHRPA